MTPGARVAAAIGVLDRVMSGLPAEQSLTNWARGARYAGSKDRAAVRDHVFQALRCRRSFACLGGAMTGRGLMIGAVRAAGTEPDLLFSGAGHAPSPLTPAEREAGVPPQAEGDRLDLPDWLVTRFRSALGEDAAAAALALQDRAPVILRVNTHMKTVSQAVDILKKDSVLADPVEIALTALRVTDGARLVASCEAYRTGVVELQDGSSQAAMAEIALSPGIRALDFCAGGGGKVLALAARGAGEWFAHDAAPERMKDLPARAGRAGVKVSVLKPGQAGRAGPYDLVLCDVPCSGSGTWRRNPDEKWRLTPARLAELTGLQSDILDRAAALVRPGGVLAYATCSLLREENEDRVSGFLDRSEGWRRLSARRWPVSAEGDGFFLARLRKPD